MRKLIFTMGVLLLTMIGGYSLLYSSSVKSKTVVSYSKPGQSSVPATPQISNKLVKQNLQIIRLTEKNTVTLDTVFDEDSVSQVMRDIQNISNNLGHGETIYLVLNTPGGSVEAGNKLISFIKALPQEVKTISLFSASMGFQTAQNLGERLVLPSSIMMSHRAKFGIQGEGPGEIFTQLKFIMSIIDELDNNAALRMQITFDDYRKLIADEYWVNGSNAVKDKAADRMILAQCTTSMVNTTKKTKVSTMFGDILVTTSKCPLIPGILKIEAANKLTQEQHNYIKSMFENKTGFTKSYIVTNEYLKFQK